MKKWTKAYQNYRDKYYAEKKLGNVKQGSIVFSPSQYKASKKAGLTDKQILNASTIFKSKGEKTQFWKQYQKMRKEYSRGETKEFNNYYYNDEQELIKETRELKYHYNFSGLMKDKYAMHLIISWRILHGEEKAEVLADYGY